MKYPFLNKPSFLALCVALTLPCYLSAMEDEDGEKNPGKAVSASTVSTPAAADSSAQREDAPPAYTSSMLAAGFEAAKAEKSDDEEDDDEVRALRKQLRDQVRATDRAKMLAAKKVSLLQRIAQLKQEADDATQAAIAALEGRMQAPAAEEADDEAQRFGVDVDARRAAVAALEDEVEDLNAEMDGRASGRTQTQEKRWEKFSDEWSRRKAERQADGRKDISDADKVKRETARVVNQVRDGVENLGKKLFGKKKKR